MSIERGRGGFISCLLLAACSAPVSGSSPELAEPATELSLACWNLEWFGSASEGPADDELQLASVRDVIRESQVDVWALVEISDASAFRALVSELPGYDGILAGDAALGKQELGLLYRTSSASRRSAEPILTELDYEFAGRPPLEVRLVLAGNDADEELVVIVLHAKAFGDLSSWERRQRASLALEEYLDEAHPEAKLAVLGDFNDDVDTSISAGQPSPYENFLAARTRYVFATQGLSASGQSSTLHHPDMIDHHLVSNELWATFIDGSAEVLEVEDFVASPASAASDHRPVVTRYER
ncbi:MAG TPA: endonuclease/exonuclease/phosphatase family protein [Polyangiaceae bacterium]|nr:endonuclease/exonuclease/phosphatase family protein [Polyangiaceae bacterium]